MRAYPNLLDVLRSDFKETAVRLRSDTNLVKLRPDEIGGGTYCDNISIIYVT